MKGRLMAAVVLVVAVCFVLCALSVFIYLKSENTDYKQFADAATSINGGVTQIIRDQHTATNTLVSQIGELNGKLDQLLVEVRGRKEKIHVIPDAPFKMEPIQIEVISHRIVEQKVPPVPAPTPGKGSRTPLLDKAGVTNGSGKRRSVSQ